MSLWDRIVNWFRPAPPRNPRPPQSGTNPPPGEPHPDDLFAQVNAARAARAIPLCTWSDDLAEVSRDNNAQQAIHGLGHYVWEPYWQCAGWNYPDAAACVQGWLNSPPHREIILDRSLLVLGTDRTGPWWTATLNV